MLKRLGPSVIPAGETTDAALFAQKLEFNPPVHENWNIVHIGMLVPEAHQIYVCGVNCMRGVVLTAAEMAASDRFSCVILREEDVVDGTIWECTRDGIADVLRKLPKLPPCVIVFPVCTHHFAGVDMASVYRLLEAEFPTVDFIGAWMDPIMQKQGLPPDQRLRKVMLDPLRPCDPKPKTVTIVGADFPLDADADLRRILSAGGYAMREIHDCGTYDDYLTLSQSAYIAAAYPGGFFAAKQAAKRLGRPCHLLPMSFDYDEISASLHTFAAALEIAYLDDEAEIEQCEAALTAAKRVIGDTPIAIDALFHPRPLGLSKLLLEHGFCVTEVYLDAAAPEESPALDWLREHAPTLELSSIMLPELRVAPRTRAEKTLAIGPKAAWFTGTEYFVNIVQGGGLWGYAGIRSLCHEMIAAFQTPKDTRDLVPRKGLGCYSCV